MILAIWPVWLFILSVLSGGYFYVEATKAGMKRKNWAVGGLILGPMLIPLFNIHRFILVKQALGRECVWLNA